MKARQLGLEDYIDNGAQISEWFADIAKASNGEFGQKDVYGVVQNGTHVCWGWFTEEEELVGVIVTSIANFSEYKTLVIVGGSGEVQDYSDLTRVMNVIAAQCQCQRFELKGRKGFRKKLEAEGWREKYTVMEKEVEPIG